MKDALKITGATLGGLAVVLLLVVGLSFFGLEMKRYFMPAHEDVRRTTFEQSQAYQHGNVQHLNRLRMQYETADSDRHRELIRQTVLDEVSTLNIHDLPPALQRWVNSL